MSQRSQMLMLLTSDGDDPANSNSNDVLMSSKENDPAGSFGTPPIVPDFGDPSTSGGAAPGRSGGHLGALLGGFDHQDALLSSSDIILFVVSGGRVPYVKALLDSRTGAPVWGGVF